MLTRTPGSVAKGALALVVLLSPAVFAAQPRVATVTFTGPRASIPRDQLVKALCDQAECVPQAQVTTRGKPDFKKVKRAGVDLVVMGAVAGPASKRMLTVTVMNAKGKKVYQDRYSLARNGMVGRTALTSLVEKIISSAEPKEEVVQREEREEREAPPPPPPKDERRDQREDREEREDAGLRQLPERSDEKKEDKRRADDVEEEEGAARPMLIAEAGVDFIHRALTYNNLKVLNLRSYETRPMLFAPRLRVEFYPLAQKPGPAQGAGLEAEFLYALGLRSIDENGVAHPTTVTRLDVGARWTFGLLKDGALKLTPRVGYRAHRFLVGRAADGSELAGLPDLFYGGVRVGVDAEYAFGAVVPFAQAAYFHALTTGEMGSDAFFPGASANGFEVHLGAGYQVLPALQVRLGLELTQYALKFSPAEGAPYQASGASDQYAGASLSARYAF